MMGFIKPILTPQILYDIVYDAFNDNDQVIRVGVVGSFSRGELTYSSDIDLVLDCIKPRDEDKMAKSLEYVIEVLDQQFIREVDFIDLTSVVEGSKSAQAFRKEGYEEMLKDLKWLYERDEIDNETQR